MYLIVNDKTYRLEFRYVTKLGKRAQLHKGSVKAVTTCVLIYQDKFIAIDNALCTDGDRFSRREGRLRSLMKLLDHCGPLRKAKADFLIEYFKVCPDPVQPQPRPKAVMSAEMKAQMKAAGQVGKDELRQRRKEARRLRSAKLRGGAAYRQALGSVLEQTDIAGSSRGPQARA